VYKRQHQGNLPGLAMPGQSSPVNACDLPI
jgi:hypothetical protein